MQNSHNFDWLEQPIASLDQAAREAALRHQSQLTKPPGSLGRLEDLAVQFAGWQSNAIPKLDDIRVSLFAADHGIAAQGVSAYPREVTAQMIDNFCAGGAAVSVLAQRISADFRVVNLGCVAAPSHHPRLLDRTLGPGSADLSEQPAMNEMQLAGALDAGREQVIEGDFELFIGGEMGIGNTTAASALEAAFLGLEAEQVVGPGTGIGGATLERKRKLIDQALMLHKPQADKPLETLRCLGGFEIAALAGAFIACGQKGVPTLVDGFICTAAALAACRLRPDLRPWLLFAHQSAEPGHRLMLRALEAEPLLALDMRLGEGSGAVLAVPILQSALALHRDMATFSQAGVSNV